MDEQVDDTERRRLQLALRLMHGYGTVGGRSRNGWGSYTLAPQGETPAWPKLPETVLRPWRDALAQDWPHALGRDERGPLVWSTGAKADWRAAMVELARLKIRLRTALQFTTKENAPRPEPRHWLAYPVTKHSVQGWGNARLPNTLRFKLRPTGHGQVEGLVFHVPALPPAAFNPAAARQVILDLWAGIHRQLDQALPRVQA
ncbi:MAG: hypothetical protein RMK34_07250 [Tepidimonas sp.]|nr:hypothetical protein [Tepidimonas sp.]